MDQYLFSLTAVFCILTPCGHPELSLSVFCHFNLGIISDISFILSLNVSVQFWVRKGYAFLRPCDTHAERVVGIQTLQPSSVWVHWGLECEIFVFCVFCQVTCILCFHWLGFLVLLFCVARVVFLSSAACFRVVMFCEDAQSRRALIGSMFVSCFVCAMSFSISCLNPAHYLTWFICPTCSYSLPPILLLYILPVFSVLCQIVG